MNTHTTLNQIYKGNPNAAFDGHAWIESNGTVWDYSDDTLLGEMGGRKGEIVRKPFPIELQKEVMRVEWKKYTKKKTTKEVDDCYKRYAMKMAGFCTVRVFILIAKFKKQKKSYKIVFGSCGVRQGKNVWWEYG